MIRKTILALMAICLAACEKNETPVYDKNYTALNVWFGSEQGVVYDNATYNFSYYKGRKDITFRARVMGLPADRDRQFQLVAVEGDIEKVGAACETETYTIPAGQTLVTGKIYFDTSKLPNPEVFSKEGEEGTLVFRVKDNGEFAPGASEMSTLTVKLYNRLQKPAHWDEAPSGYMNLSRFFGKYSRVKYQFMIENTGYVDFHVTFNQSVKYDEETNTLSYAYANYIRQVLVGALAMYNSSHETPLTDETGELVTF
ncbi:MAG: DUF4843 domain-containing protein [Bacteroidaceae bacterium]|nr:DUF4843 domain-containing protein [Bacteroidaceae bacterium]